MSKKDMPDVVSNSAHSNVHVQNNATSEADAAQTSAVQESAAAEEEEADTDTTCIPDGHYVIAYGHKTISAIEEAISKSFKLFWDGSICMFIDATLSANNNKEVLKCLLEHRRKTNEHQDPPVTLLHGEETERLLRSTLLVIKDDEQKALEAKQRALENRVEVEEEEDDEENEEDALDMGEESEEKLTTFQ